MKRLKLFFAGMLAAALSVTAFAGGELGRYDFASYGTTFSITNSGASARTIDRIFITYDQATNGTLTIDRTFASTTWRVDTEVGAVVTYDLWEPTVPLQWRPGEVLKFTQTETNCQIMLEFTEND